MKWFEYAAAIMACVLLASAMPLAWNANTGLYASWPHNDSTGTKVTDIVNGWNFTTTGTPLWNTTYLPNTNVSNNSLHYDGATQYALETENKDVYEDLQGNGTMQVWVWRDATTSDYPNYYFHEQSVVGSTYHGVWDKNSTHTQFYFSADGVQQNVLMTCPVIQNNKWTMLAVTWNNATDNFTAYVNGTPCYSVIFAFDKLNAGTTMADLEVGRHDDSKYFKGLVTDARFWNYALNASQINDLYLYGKEAPTTITSHYFNATYNSIVYETVPETLQFDLYYNASIFKAAYGLLTINGSNYTPTTFTTSANYANYTYSFTPQLVQTNLAPYNETFNYTYTYLNNTNYSVSYAFTQNVTWSTYFNSVNATPSNALTGDLMTITSNVSYRGSATYTVGHYWNNTNTTAPYSSGGLWISTATAPTITAITSVNASAYLNTTFNGTTYLRIPTTNYTVTVYPLNLTTCGGGLPVIINYTSFNEDTLAPLLTSHYITITAWNNVRTINSTFNFTFAPTYGAQICIGVNASVLLDSFHLYNATSTYGQRAHFLYNYSASNASMQTIPLYLQTVTPAKATKITVLDANGIPLKNTDLTIQRYYPGNSTYLSVAMIRTDNSGQGYTYLQPNDVFYYFSATKSGVFQGLFNSQQIICDSSLTLCTLSLQLDPTNNTFLNTIGKITASCTWNNATNVSSCTFVDTSGYYHYYTMLAIKQGVMANTVICNTTSYTSSGTITCTLSATGQYAVILTASGSPTGALAGLNVNNGNPQGLFAQAGLSAASGAFLALPVVIAVLLGAATAPATGLLFGIFALIFMGVLGLFYLSTATIAALIIFGVLVAWKLKV